MKFAIDTNVIIEWWKISYPKDYFPSFWDWFKEKLVSGDIILCECVYKEVSAGQDSLSIWLKSCVISNNITVESDASNNVIQRYAEVINSANNNKLYKPSALTEFANVADGWLIAHAKANNYVVVTNETFDSNCKKRVKIPNICVALNVQYIKGSDIFKDLVLKL